MGAYNPLEDVIYLNRNVFFEGHSAAEAFPVILRHWAEGEPAIVSTHRANYVSLRRENADRGYAKLEDLLGRLTAKGVRFLTTAEVGDLYRQGWSWRTTGGKQIVRKWAEDAEPIQLPPGTNALVSIADGKSFLLRTDGTGDVPPGDYVARGPA